MPVLSLEQFTFDRLRQKYVDDDGRALGDDELKRLIFLLLLAYRTDFERWARQLVAGEITLAEWQQRMIGAIKRLHTAVAAAARGGTASLEDRDIAYLHGVLRFQYERLDRFARQIEARSPYADTEKRVVARAEMYAAAASQTFEEERRIGHEVAGFTEEINVLGASEHCSECLQITSLGWQRIGTLKPPGTRLCRANCRCRFRFRHALQT